MSLKYKDNNIYGQQELGQKTTGNIQKYQTLHVAMRFLLRKQQTKYNEIQQN